MHVASPASPSTAAASGADLIQPRLGQAHCMAANAGMFVGQGVQQDVVSQPAKSIQGRRAPAARVCGRFDSAASFVSGSTAALSPRQISIW